MQEDAGFKNAEGELNKTKIKGCVLIFLIIIIFSLVFKKNHRPSS